MRRPPSARGAAAFRLRQSRRKLAFEHLEERQMLSTATFVATDTTTQGYWQNHYGAGGYDMVDGDSSSPSGAPTISISGKTTSNPGADTNARPSALWQPSSDVRISAVWYNNVGDTLAISLGAGDGQSRQVALYAYDFSGNTSETIQVLDGVTGSVLDTETVNYNDGALQGAGTYLSWNVQGAVTFSVTAPSGQTPQISGVFFGGGTAPAPSGAATALGEDDTTEGQWEDSYGSDGYDMAGGAAPLPSYVSTVNVGGPTATDSGADNTPGALWQPGSTSGLAAEWYWYSNDGSLYIDAHLTGGQAHEVAFYVLNLGGTNGETVDALDDATGAVLATQTVSNFNNGKYLNWDVSGDVTFRITGASGSGAEASALFFGPANPSPLNYTGGYVSIPESVQSDAQVATYLAANPVVASPVFNATFTPVVVGPNGQYPILPGGWIANTATSQWMGPTSTGASTPSLAPFVFTDTGFSPTTSAPQGLYYYTTTINVPAGSVPSLTDGLWTSDNQGLAIFLNGHNEGDVNNNPGAFASWTPFTVNNADFVTGTNTLTFVAFNEGYSGGRVSPTGLRVQYTVNETPPTAAPSLVSLSGTVYDDANNDGVDELGEPGVGGETVTLTGTDSAGVQVTRTAVTTGDGTYSFTQLVPGTYSLVETLPAGAIGGKDTAGSEGGTPGTNAITAITLVAGVNGFGYDFGHDRPPTFTSVPLDTLRVGAPYTYTATATDPDGDTLTYSKVSGPAGLTVSSSGQVSWTSSASPGDVGTHAVGIEVSDGRGGTAVQDYTLTVLPATVYPPPHYTSTPVVDAYVGTPYDYPSTVADPDGDPLTFSLTAGPAGLTYSAGGVVSWTPTAAQLGLNQVAIRVDDQHGGYDTQIYNVMVHPADTDPYIKIVSTPVSSYQFPVWASGQASVVFDSTLRDVQSSFPDVQEGVGSSVVPGLVNSQLGLLQLTGSAASGSATATSFSWQALVAPSTGTAGSSFTVQRTYQVSGAAPTANFLIAYYASPNTSLGQGGDVLLGTETITAAADKALGTHAGTSPSLVLPAANGSYHIFARIDAGGAVGASSTSEVTTAGPITVSGASSSPASVDLNWIGGGVSGPTEATALASGAPFTIEREYNVSGGAAPASFTIAYYASTSPTPGGGTDFLLGSETISSTADRAVGTHDGLSPTLQLPAAGGVYYVFVTLNAGNTVPETNTTNNVGLTRDRTPTYAGGSTEIHSTQTFYDWYHDNPGVNQTTAFPIVLTADPTVAGQYDFNSSNFFPTDGRLFGNDDSPDLEHNFNFMVEFHGSFTYHGGETLSLQSDDDTWVFINNQLVVDNGGVHSETGHSVSADGLGLVVGQSYPIDIFYAERQTPQAALQLQTNLQVVPDAPYTYQVHAIDSDGGAISYALEKGPLGMTIDPATGIVSWQPGQDQVGTYTVTVEAIDANGATDTQTYPLTVSNATSAAATPVKFTSAPVTSMDAGQTYAYTPIVSAPAGDRLTYTLISGPDLDPVDPTDVMTINATTGALSWTPKANDDGQNFLVTVRVADALGNSDTQQFNLLVNDFTANAPQFISAPVTAATAGSAYTYHAVATDTDGDPLSYSLVAPYPSGMSIVAATGQISWTPGYAQTGPQSVVVRVDDLSGGTSVGFNVQPYTVIVAGVADTPPVFAITPVTSATVEELYTSPSTPGTVVATDADGDPLTYDLPVHPQGMIVDPTNGTIYWVPTGDQEGSQSVVERVSDGRGGVALLPFTINVAAPDTPPIITSIPTGTPEVGKPYIYTILAQHAGGGTLTYSVTPVSTPSLPTGMSIAGNVLTWTPAAVGSVTVDVVVTDSFGNSAIQPIPLTAIAAQADNAPTISSTPPTSVTLGTTYYYQVVATDPDGDPLTYQLNTSPAPPAGVSLNPTTGMLTWTPTAASLLGVHSFGLTVSDGRGGTYSQTVSITVTAGSTKTGPVITSTGWPTGVVGDLYSYNATASDLDTDVLAWSLLQAPDGLSVNPATGTVRWYPTQVGTYDVELEVQDPYGDYDLQSYTINVLGTAPPPVITSTAPTTGTTGTPYSYQVVATDPDGDPLTYTLVGTYPSGMQFSTTTPGLLQWTNPVVGSSSYPLEIAVSDGTLGSDTQSWALTIAAGAGDGYPVFASSPPTHAVVGVAYPNYQLIASDPANNPLTYSLAAGAPSWLTVSASGLLTAASGQTPGTIGTYPVTVIAANSFGYEGLLSYSINVTVNHPPTIATTTLSSATAGGSYLEPIVASDPDGDPLTYALTYTLPTGVTAGTPGPVIDPNTGRITWTPGSALANTTWPVTVTVTDPFGLSDNRSYSLPVVPETTPPTVAVEASVPRVDVGQSVTFTVAAVDAVGVSSLTLTVNGVVEPLNPDGTATIPTSAAGTLTAVATATNLSGYTGTSPSVSVQVIDPSVTDVPTATILAQQSTVTATATGLSTFTPLSIAPGSSQSSTLNVNDAATIQSMLLNLYVTGNTTGLTVTLRGPDGTTYSLGAYQAMLGVTAAAGKAAMTATSGTYTLTLTNASSATSSATLTGWSLSYTKALSSLVTAPINIIGTVNDAQSPSTLTYTLSVAPVGSDQFTVLNPTPGTGSVTNGVVGTFDPTIYADGSYDLRLIATNAGGQSTEADQTVSVTGNLKLGNLHLSFTDLSLSLAGIPITITRTYDSLNAGTQGDFGYGWTLGEEDVQLQVSAPDGSLAATGQDDPLQLGTHVEVTLPGKNPEGFTFEPQPEGAGGFDGGDLFGFDGSYTAAFVPDPGVTDTLSVPPVELLDNTDGTYSLADSGDTYSASDFTSYTLATRDGTQYLFDSSTGALQSEVDRNGNSLTFTPSGIFSSTGVAITIQRNGPQGQISSITDPRGDWISYSYDSNGDLASVTDRAQNTTYFSYDSTPAHFLDHVTDALGNVVARADYSGGRVTSLMDADGVSSGLSYNLATLSETVTPPAVDGVASPSSTVTYDSQGNVSGGSDALGNTSAADYLGTNLMSQSQSVVGQDQTTQSTTTSDTYDQYGDVTSSTDAAGHTSYYSYGAFGLPTSVTDADGDATGLGYDGNGNLTSTTSPGGVTSSSTYNPDGSVATSTSPDGTTSFSYYAAGQPGDITPVTVPDNKVGVVEGSSGESFSALLEGSPGETAGSTDPRGVTTFNGYDKDGNQVVTATVSVNPAENPGDPTGIGLLQPGDTLEQAFNDSNLNAVTVIDTVIAANGSIAWTDAAHAPGATISQITRTNQGPNGTTTTTTYYGVTLTASFSLYDGDDRLIQTTTATGATSETYYDADGHAAWTVDVHVPGSQADGTFTAYDADGRVVSTQQFHGVVIPVEIPTTGAPYSMTPEINGAAYTTIVGSSYPSGDAPYSLSSTVYDSQGRVVWADDSHLYNQTPDGTYTVYDADGNAIATQRYSDVTIQATEGMNGAWSTALTSTPTEISSAETVYNSAGQVIWSIDPHAPTATTVNATETLYNPDGSVAATDRYHGTTITLNTSDPANSSVTINAVGTLYSTTSSTYDKAGTLLTSTDALGNKTTYNTTYPSTGGTLSTTTDADGSTSSTFTDSNGRKVSSTDQDGNVTTYGYNGLGDLTAVYLPPVTSATGQTVSPSSQYTYDTFGNMVSETDPDGNTTTYVYNALGQETSETLPTISTTSGTVTPTETWSYNLLGQLASSTDFDGNTITYQYDSEGRVIEKQDYAAGSTTASETVTYTYDNLDTAAGPLDNTTSDTVTIAGNANSAANGTTTTYSDAQGQTVEIASPQGTINYQYDPVTGETIETTTANTDIVDTYDAEGRLQTVTADKLNGASASQVTSYTYDANGNLLTTTFPNSTVETRTYDALNRLTSVVTANATGTVLFGASYTLDADGLRRQEVDQPSGRIDTYTYDADGRLTQESVTNDGAGNFTDTYEYDAAGNRTELIESNRTDVTYTYDADGRLTLVDSTDAADNRSTETFTYDAQGNTLTDTKGSQTTTYTWDAENRMTSVVTTGSSAQTVTYAYDDSGNRVSETVNGVTTTYLNDPTAAYTPVLEESVGGALTVTYVRGLDLILQNRTGTGGTGLSYYAVDGLGSTRALTNASGVVTDTDTYDAYGNVIAHTGTTVNEILFASYQVDTTGQYHTESREINPTTGVFDSRDSYNGSTTDPITGNHYVYANADPVNGIDPTGHDDAVDVVTAATEGAAIDAYLFYGGLAIYAGVQVFRALAASAAAPEVSAIAEGLGVQVITDIEQLQESQNYVYFVHGSTAENWMYSTRIDTTKGNGEFGQGFYAFQATPSGFRGAVNRAMGHGFGPFVLVVRVKASDYDSLSKLQFNGADAEWQLAVRSYRSGGIYPPAELADVVIGPVASSKPRQGFYKSLDKLPDQYAFKVYAGAKLQPVAIIPL